MANSRPSFFYRVLHLKVVKDESLKQMISKRSISYRLLTKQECVLNMYPFCLYLTVRSGKKCTVSELQPFYLKQNTLQTLIFQSRHSFIACCSIVSSGFQLGLSPLSHFFLKDMAISFGKNSNNPCNFGIYATP